MNYTASRAKVLVQQQQNQINFLPFLAVQDNFTNIRTNDRCCAKLENMILLLAVKSSFFTTYRKGGTETIWTLSIFYETS